MTRLEHTIDIQRPVADVYALAKQVERYPEFLPGYLESRILERRNGTVLLQRKAFVKGKMRYWRSWVRFVESSRIEFMHASGPLEGMRIAWTFIPLSPRQTRLRIVHEMHVVKPWGWGRVLEKAWYAPGVNQMANSVIRDFKLACESTRHSEAARV